MKKLLLVLLCFCATTDYAQIINTVAGNDTAGFAGDGGAATAAQLQYPFSSIIDSLGNMYIADRRNSRVRKVGRDGIISTVAGNGIFGSSGDGGAATAAELDQPYSLAFDTSGLLFISDVSQIRWIDHSGIMHTYAGIPSLGFSGDGGPATAARFENITSIAFDRSNNLYLADYGNNRVRMVTPSGIVNTIAGSGATGYGGGGFSGDGGPASNAKLSTPEGVIVDDSGNIIIADRLNNRVRKINTSGIISTIAGNGTSGFSGDGGPATAATFNNMTGLCIDRLHNLYICEISNNRVRKIDSTGVITTYAGTGVSGSSGDGGPATAAEMYSPCGITVDRWNNIFVTADYNHSVRKIGPGNITGADTLCVRTSAAFGSITTGGTWSISDTSVGHIDAAGTLTGLAGGTTCVSYTAPTGMSIKWVYVNPLPVAGIITGVDSFCLNEKPSFHASGTGGTWMVSNPSLATVSSGGVVYAMTSRVVDTIEYVVTNRCGSDTARFGFYIRWCEAGVAGTGGRHQSNILVIPNPGFGNQHLLISSAYDEMGFAEITTITGEKVATFQVTTNKEIQFLFNQTPGLYLVRVVTQHENLSTRLVLSQ